MSCLTPDYLFFRDTYGGVASSDAFDGLVADAEAYVKNLIGWNEVDTPEKEIAYKRAVCAAVQVFADYGDGSGFTIGSFTLRAEENQQVYWQMQRKIIGELIASGLLWGGIA